MKNKKTSHKQHAYFAGRVFVWFFLGALLGLFFFISFIVIYYKQTYQNKIYPGVFVDNINFGGKTQEDVKTYFQNKNIAFEDTTFTLSYEKQTAVTTAKELSLGYDASLLADQAYSIGRSKSAVSDIYMLTRAYMRGINLPPAYTFNENKFLTLLKPFQDAINIAPVNAEFSYADGRVTEFKTPSDGKTVDTKTLLKKIHDQVILLTTSKGKKDNITFEIPVIKVSPDITLEKLNNRGIKELVGRGTSLFHGSIENRIFNLSLASSRLNGILIKPGETFSFADAVGDVSSLTGYKQAYVIENGRTVLGDGGGVCQVSTTLFRAALAAGLPIVERNPHAYRVHYYEEDSGPGIDAAVYVPSVDLKFKNDTGNWLLIQTKFNRSEERLTFELYGTNDGREVTMSNPVIHSQSPAPEPLYQDDPTLPQGVVKQIDWSATGAKVSFTRDVKRNGEILQHDVFTSNYRPWQAVYLRGTKPV